MDFIAFFSAFGLGAIFNSFVQMWLSNRLEIKKRNFNEKKECYVGLLDAYRTAHFQNNIEDFAYWSERCMIVFPENIRKIIKEMKKANRDTQGLCFDNLQNSIRKDLGITKK